MTITVNLNDTDTRFVESYARTKGLTVSELAKAIILEHIEDKTDLQDLEKAIEEYKKNPVSYSLDEVEKELGL